MGAPASAYTGLSLFIGDCEHLQAKLDTSYDTMKARFYLDELIGCEKGVVGCVIPGGTNALFHNLVTQGGKGRINGLIMLNDSLNTKGICYPGDITSLVFTTIKIEFDFKCSFYNESTSYGCIYRYRLPDDSGWGAWSSDIDIQPVFGGLYPNQSSIKEIQIPSSGSATRKVQARPFIVNSIGRFEGNTIDVTPTLVSVSLESNTSWTGNPTTFYIDDTEIQTLVDNSIAVGLYSDSAGVTRYNTVLTLWKDSRYYYEYGYDIGLGGYYFIRIVDSSPPPSYNIWPYQGYSDFSQMDADDAVIYGFGPSGNLYESLSDSLFYQDASLTALAVDGFYAQGDFSGVVDTKYLLSGVNQY